MAKIERVERGTGYSTWPLIVVRLPKEAYAKIKALAKTEGVSRGLVAMRLVERGLKEVTRARKSEKPVRKAKAKTSRKAKAAKAVLNGHINDAGVV